MPRTQQLGRYHLLDRLACGGMAEVYRAKTFDVEGRAHLVAIKRVLSHLVTDDDFIQMLVDEAKIAGTLRHQNIAQVYEFVHLGDHYFLAMEYVDGKDVRSILDRSRQRDEQVPPADAAFIAAAVCDALEVAHTQRDASGAPLKIVHRDISPSNVLCSYHGEVKLCDFGIAKAALSRVQTRTGVIKGKVKYMSPEQAMGKRLDGRSDIFSLGVVLYEMLTRQPPFTAPGEMELIFAVREARYAPIREYNPEVPPTLCAIVDRALARSRSDRFQSARDFGEALREFLKTHYPRYHRNRLAHLMRRLFAAEIERDLRLLEDYIVEGAATAEHEVGVNLIADALGAEATFSRFTPIAPEHGPGAPVPDAPDYDLHRAETVILPLRRARLTPPPLPEPDDLQSAETRIIRRSDAEPPTKPR
ncbi:MAG TPA: serine/threonine-protein kinase [Polyangia bacterium]|jgi:serine/threonine-protein kinase